MEKRKKREPVENMVGETYGIMTVKEITSRPNTRNRYAVCECACGNVKEVQCSDLRAGKVKSCGCQRYIKKHNKSKTRIWAIWEDMHQRCENPNHKAYEVYGMRGVIICDAWYDFNNFLEWANASGYDDNLTLDRMDPDGMYEPNNCRWVSKEYNSRHRRGVTLVIDNYEVLTLPQLADRYGLSYTTIRTRYKDGKRGADLTATPKRKRKGQP